MPDAFAGLYRPIGPWAELALWHDRGQLPIPTVPLEPELPEILRQRLGPLLLRCLRQRAPEVLAPVKATLEADAFARAVASSAILQQAEVISQKLNGEGICTVVVKGPTTAACYPTWQDRPFGDVDFYLQRSQFRAALQLCEQWGLTEDLRSRQPRRFADYACREAINLRSSYGASIDLHHHVPPWYWGRGLDASDLLARGIDEEFLGHRLRAAGPEDNLLIAALHIISDKNTPGSTLLIWRDIVELARVCDPVLAATVARKAGLSWWLRRCLEELPVAVRPTEVIAEVEASETPPRGRRRLALLTSPRIGSVGIVATQPLRLPVGRAVLFASAMAVPSREFLEWTFPDDPHPRRRWMMTGLQRRGLGGSDHAA